MTASDFRDETGADYEQFEAERLAQDRDATGVATGAIDDAMARNQVSELVDADVVTPLPEGRILFHEPSGRAFESIQQLAVFHRGWTAGRDADEVAE